MSKAAESGSYAPVPADWDDDDNDTNGHVVSVDGSSRIRSSVQTNGVHADLSSDDDELNDSDRAVLHDVASLDTTTRRVCGQPAWLVAVVAVALLLLVAAVVSYEDKVPAIPPPPAAVHSRVEEFKHMLTWGTTDTPLAYQQLPSAFVLTDTPPAVSALRACQSTYNTTRAMLLLIANEADAASEPLITGQLTNLHRDSGHGFCLLVVSALSSFASSPPSADAEHGSVVTHVATRDMRALPYQYVREAEPPDAAQTTATVSAVYAKTVGSLLLMHAGFDVVVDVHSPSAAVVTTERITQLLTLDYSAATYTTGDHANVSAANRSHHHCSAAVQLSSASNALLDFYRPRTSPAALVPLTSHELLTLEPSSVHSTAVLSPAFAGLYLPSSAPSMEAAYTLRSLVYLTFLSFLWVPSRPAAFLAHHGLSNASRANPSMAGTPADWGPAPALLNQSHISACIVRWLHSEGSAQPVVDRAQAQKDADEKTAQADEAVQLRQTVQLLSDSMLGHVSDAQQAMRAGMVASGMEQGEAVRRSQQADELLEQIYTYVSQQSTGVVTTRDIRELRAFHADMRNIALTTQQLHTTKDAAAAQQTSEQPAAAASSLAASQPGPLSPFNNIPPPVVVPRQSRIAVCLQFNYAADDHALHALLTYHARLHRHLLLSMPVSAHELSASQRALLAQFPDVTFLYCASYRGYFQYRCLHQCLVQSRASHPDSAGLLFLADDAWFNFTQSLVQWDKWQADEFWYHSKAYLMDMSLPFKAYYGAFEPQWFHEQRDYHVRLQRSYYSWPQRYRDALNSVYGEDHVATEALSDVLYVPRADAQMDNLIEVLGEQMGQVDVWCEVMTAVLVDLAMTLSGHRPNLPIFPATSQQVAIFLNQQNYKDRDGVVRYIDGVQVDADHMAAPDRFYQYMRRGATSVTRAMQNDTLLAQDVVGAATMARFPLRAKQMADYWLDEMNSMRTQRRNAEFFDPPQPVAACALHYSDDGLVPTSALRPVLLRPDGNVVLPHRKNIKFARWLVEGEGTGWIHPIKMSERGGEFTQLGVESLNRMVVQMSGLLWEDQWWRRRTQCAGAETGADDAKHER